MKKHENNYAFINGANLHKGVLELGWKLDYRRFRRWLKDKFKVGKAYIFLGFIPENTGLYLDLQNAGYIVVFKPTIFDSDGAF